jgi:uncharacterized membrane protein
MTKPVPRSVQEYLDQLRAAFAGEDPALAQDALYDAEEYLRGELHDHPEKTEEQVLAAIATTYGAPEEVAEAYRATEAKVQVALRTPRPQKRSSSLGKFFGVLADPRAYGALFYMVLSMFTGIFYFVWAVTGMSLSLGLMVLIIGLPFCLLFLGSTRLLSLVEGRIVETLLGVRMPRRPVHPGGSRPFKERVIEVFTDRRTWTTLLYMVLQLGLGIIYFTLFVTIVSIAATLILSPVELLGLGHMWIYVDDEYMTLPIWVAPLLMAFGVLVLVGFMHLARGIGYMHGHIAKNLLVQA